MPFLGNLHDDRDGMVEITNGSLDTMSMEVSFLNRRGTRIERILAVSVPGGVTRQFPVPIPRLNPSRLIIEVATPVAGGFFTFRLVQGALSFLVDFVEDNRLVLDVIPAP